MDDSFLELPPAWYRERCAGDICPLTDLARLLLARPLLASGYERVIWVDADMLVFDPDALPWISRIQRVPTRRTTTGRVTSSE